MQSAASLPYDDPVNVLEKVKIPDSIVKQFKNYPEVYWMVRFALEGMTNQEIVSAINSMEIEYGKRRVHINTAVLTNIFGEHLYPFLGVSSRVGMFRKIYGRPEEELFDRCCQELELTDSQKEYARQILCAQDDSAPMPKKLSSLYTKLRLNKIDAASFFAFFHQKMQNLKEAEMAAQPDTPSAG